MGKIFFKSQIDNRADYSKEKSNQYGEVFTPWPVIRDMVKSFGEETLSDPSKTYLDPCAGLGQMPCVLINYIFKHTRRLHESDESCLKHIIEEQVYMCEFQKESAEFINDVFSLDGKFKVNLYCGDTLLLPEEFFDLSHEERVLKYPHNCVK